MTMRSPRGGAGLGGACECDTLRACIAQDTRDGLVGGDYSSKFAPWLAQGCITSRWIHTEIMRCVCFASRVAVSLWIEN
jgi:hypothetical protein